MSLFSGIPEWVDFRSRLDERRQLHSGLVAAVTEADQQYRAAVTEHRAAVEAAVRAGDPIPTDEPPPPSESHRHAVRTSQQVLEALAAEGHRLRGALAPRVEAMAEARYVEIVGEVREAVATIDRAAREVTDMLRDLASARSAADEAAGVTARPSRAARTRSSLSPGALCEHVQSGRSPLAVLGLTQSLGDGDRVVLGLQHYEAASGPSDGGEEVRRLRSLPPAQRDPAASRRF